MMPKKSIFRNAPTIVRPAVKTRKTPTLVFANPGVTYYKQNKFGLINNYLRTGQIHASEAEREIVERNIEYINSAMRTGLDTAAYPLLYRGTGYYEFGFRYENFAGLERMVGERITWKAFTSTSVNKRAAEKHSHGLLIVFIPNSTTRFIDMRMYTNLKHQQEDEILLDKDLSGVIEKVEPARKATDAKSYAEVLVRLL